jgi:hypothetical protein
MGAFVDSSVSTRVASGYIVQSLLPGPPPIIMSSITVTYWATLHALYIDGNVAVMQLAKLDRHSCLVISIFGETIQNIRF